MYKPTWLHFWTYLSLSSIPIAAYFIIFTEIRNWVILVFHVSGLVAILFCQKIYHRYQFQICSRCFIQREFHNKKKYNKLDYPDLYNPTPIVCDNFVKVKYA